MTERYIDVFMYEEQFDDIMDFIVSNGIRELDESPACVFVWMPDHDNFDVMCNLRMYRKEDAPWCPDEPIVTDNLVVMSSVDFMQKINPRIIFERTV